MLLNPIYAVMSSLCLSKWADAAVYSTKVSHATLCCSRWRFNTSVVAFIYQRSHPTYSGISPSSADWFASALSPLADCQTALIRTSKSIFMHCSKVDSGASFKFKGGKLPSGCMYHFFLKLSTTLCAISWLAFSSDEDVIVACFPLLVLCDDCLLWG